MDRTLSPTMRGLAQRLIAHESGGARSRPAAVRVSDKLRRPLVTLVGIGGFRPLLSRALALAAAKIPGMKVVQVGSDGRLEGFDKAKAELSPAELNKGQIMLIAQLLGLLAIFIGEGLTLGLVQDAWPQATLKGSGDKGKKT